MPNLPTSPEIQTSPEPSERHGDAETGRENFDFGSHIERAPERIGRPQDGSAPAIDQKTQATTAVSQVDPVDNRSKELVRIRASLFKGVDYEHASKAVLVNHLLVNHNMDLQLAYDLVEFLRSEL